MEKNNFFKWNLKKYKVNIINHERDEGHVLYVLSVEDLITGITISFLERYSNLRNLYEVMKKESSNKNFPSFPPKKFFGSEDAKFIKTREKDLNEFFEKINNNDIFSELPSFIKYIKVNFKKYEIKEKITTKQIQQYNQPKINNIINYYKGKRLTPEEYKKECIEGKKIVDDYNLKFISLDYDIDINSNEKNEIKYQNLIKEKLILNDKDKVEFNNLDNGNDDNLNYIGNKEEHYDNIVNSIKQVIELKYEQFCCMTKMMDIDEFILK